MRKTACGNAPNRGEAATRRLGRGKVWKRDASGEKGRKKAEAKGPCKETEEMAHGQEEGKKKGALLRRPVDC